MKKYINHSLLCLFTVIAFNACNYDSLMLFNEKPSVYYSLLVDVYTTGEDNRTNDSINVKFFYTLENVVLVNIPVSITGPLSNVDRYAAFEVNAEASTAVEGTHYEFLANRITTPANSTGGTLTVRIIRSPDLQVDGKTLKLAVKLVPNEHFNTDYNRKLLSTTTGKSKQIIEFPIYVSDIITVPKHWNGGAPTDVYIFGPFSVKKCLLVCEVNNIPPSFLDGEPLVDVNGEIRQITTANVMGITQTFAKWTQIYLNQQKALGNTIYEADGVTEMKMGSMGQP